MRKDVPGLRFDQVLQLLTISPHLPLMNTLDALAQQPERVVGKAEQPLDARAESIHHRVASRFAEDQNLGDVRDEPDASGERWPYPGRLAWGDRRS
jgi:hypothetical protein